MVCVAPHHSQRVCVILGSLLFVSTFVNNYSSSARPLMPFTKSLMLDTLYQISVTLCVFTSCFVCFDCTIQLYPEAFNVHTFHLQIYPAGRLIFEPFL